jgi:hypothetical protein
MTRYQKSSLLWALLICAAREHKRYAFEELKDILGISSSGALASCLNPILFYCEEESLPPLVALIKDEAQHLPPVVEDKLDVTTEVIKSIFDFDWFSVEPPQNVSFNRADRLVV